MSKNLIEKCKAFFAYKPPIPKEVMSDFTKHYIIMKSIVDNESLSIVQCNKIKNTLALTSYIFHRNFSKEHSMKKINKDFSYFNDVYQNIVLSHITALHDPNCDAATFFNHPCYNM